MMKNLTVKQLLNICKENRYILARYPDGFQVGINCKIAKIAQKNQNYNPTKETRFVSYLPCSFNEYLNNKAPYV
jgi:hypothetical protein